MKNILIVCFSLGFFLIAGCSNASDNTKFNFSTVGNPCAEAILKQDRKADIFMLAGIVYQNAEHIDWVIKSDLTISKEMGVIKKQYQTASKLENEMSTVLPIGSKIYATKENQGSILIAERNGKKIVYLGLIEG
jgi:hypothetical protein